MNGNKDLIRNKATRGGVTSLLIDEDNRQPTDNHKPQTTNQAGTSEKELLSKKRVK
jgi:hypothetical protein